MNNSHIEPTTSRSKNGGVQRIYRFDNGYGASAVQGPYTYGGTAGLWELAVLKLKGDSFDLDYSTPVTADVIGHLNDDQLQAKLRQIRDLTKDGLCADEWHSQVDKQVDTCPTCEEATPNYVEQVRSKLAQLLPDCDTALLDLYTLLAIQYGPHTDLVMVHNAWSVWRNRTDPTHPSLIPFPFLAPEVQELDRPYMDAIHQAIEAVDAR